MTLIKRIKDWHHVLLDTSVIIDYLKNPARFANNPAEQKRIEQTKKLINYLSPPDRESAVRCTFLISSITIAELIKTPTEDQGIQSLVLLFKGADVMLLDFTVADAETLIRRLSEYLPEGQKHQLVGQLERDLKDHGVSWARQWVSDDLKILASAAAQRRLDVVLTADGRTFFSLAQNMGIPCVNMNALPKDLFDELDTDIAPKG